ncbi:MAG: LptF/LptG family permease [Candidatus Omnitrophota bacterium]
MRTIPMLRTADVLILKELWRTLAFNLGLFAALSFTLVLFTDLGKMMEYNASFGPCVSYIVLSFPHEWVKSIPIVVVLSVVAAMVSLIRHNELLMLFIAGYSPLRLAVPIGAALAATILTFFFVNEDIAGPFAAQARAIMQIRIKGGGLGVSGGPELWLHGEGDQIYYAREYSPYAKEIKGLTIFRFQGPNKTLSARYDAERAVWNEAKGAWRVKDMVAREINEDGSISRDIVTEDERWIDRTPADFDRITQDIEQMSRKDLARIVKSVRGAGQDPRAFLPHLRIKEAFPFAAFFLGMLAYAVCLRMRSKGKTFGIGLGLLAVIAYYMSLSFGRSLAENGAMPAWLSAWAPNLVCFSLTIYFFYQLREEI